MGWFGKKKEPVVEIEPETPKRWGGEFEIDRYVQRSGEEYFKVRVRSHFHEQYGDYSVRWNTYTKTHDTQEEAEAFIEKQYQSQIVRVEENIPPLALPDLFDSGAEDA